MTRQENGRAVQRQAVGVLGLGGVALLGAVSVLLGWPDWAELGRWTRPHAAVLVLLAVTVVCVAMAARLRARAERVPSRRAPVLSWGLVAGAGAVVAVVAWGATSWLLGEAAAAKDVGTARVDAIKTGLGIGAGTTGIFALLLAVRRQQHNESDATEKNVTELYTKAADQLGSDKAPVRLAGLYALDRLAHGNPSQRQSIVNVICAYLRMPYTPPAAEPPCADAEEARVLRAEHHERTQEREVRLAAQRILTEHLKLGRHEAFWADIDLDLTNAHLIDFDLAYGRTGKALFVGATFTGDTRFDSATFTKNVRFDSATFTGNTQFVGATFAGSARFERAAFTDHAWFVGATFTSHAWFEYATFTGDAQFAHATFTDHAWFVGATFTSHAWFEHATFTGDARFVGATFTQNARFGDATFAGDACFSSASFTYDAWFGGASFTGDAQFDGVRFGGNILFDDATRDGVPFSLGSADASPS